jgi:outer membrane protein assembly factor BamA
MRRGGHRLQSALTAVLIGLLPLAAATATELDVEGLGLFGNIAMERRLAFLAGTEPGLPQELDLVQVEDLAYILLQLLKKEGHPEPVVTARLQMADGTTAAHDWSSPFKPLVMEEAGFAGAIEAVVLECRPGILNYYDAVDVAGVESIKGSVPRDFFIPSGVLFTSRRDRAFTTANFKGRIGRLLSALRGKGHALARVVSKELQIDPESGAVRVQVAIEEGPVHRIGSVRVEGADGRQPEAGRLLAGQADSLLTGAALQEGRQVLLNALYHAGHPDAQVRVETLPRVQAGTDAVAVDLVYQLDPGPFVMMDGYQFEPEGLLRFSVLERQVDLRGIEVYDLLAVEEGRRRLLALGVFRDVELDPQPVGDGRRRAVYILHPAPRHSLRLRVGYGSYELGRVGFRYERLNLWGRAHRLDIQGKQSFKSTLLEGTYSIPHFFDKRITAHIRAGYEFREEISYDRSTSRFSLGASRGLGISGAEVSAEYAIEQLDSTRASAGRFDSLDRATVASLGVRAVLDRRDSALYPTRGYDLTGGLKLATDLLGGQANFRKVEITTSTHKYLGSALYLHVGLRFGAIFSEGPTADNLPFNERFFPGGENSVRGYQRGEATPLSELGEPIGAESMAQANVELEQRVLRNISLVVFWDGLAIDQNREGFPDDAFLQSVGMGIRWRTPVGPVRLEYGHNLERRPFDPRGTLHLAVGFPF